ncbi:CvpA family protein [Planctomyces sp. SH-PL62]|uniref:CvpA family protein n=1 Tax=Planctomyces sp. SH-PL62 TaxID=1636152 RepID=UPI00078DA279|nr:CvpA family protein [Planctomyces sp. SH-PL62]AMV38167.1 Colicin V production protein [Planctomyces sp. SH-PL62]
MTIYDMAMAAVLIAGMVRGAWRGITWQLASIGSLVLGYLFSYPVSAMIAPHLPGTPEAARAMSMAGAYLTVSGAVFGAAWMVRNVIRKMKFEAYDRHLGMMLGGVEGVAVGILGTMLVVSVAPATRQPIFASPTGKVVNGVVSHVGPVLPAEVRNALAPFWNGAGPVAADSDGAEVDAVADDSDANFADATEAAPLRDPNVRAVASRAASRLDAEVGRRLESGATADAEALAPETAELPSAREVMSRLVEQGKRKAEEAVVQSLDVDPDGKASTIRDLIEKDKARLQDAVSGAVDETRRNLTGQVTDAVDETRRNVTDQLQGRAGQLQGKAGDVQRRIGEARSRLDRTQEQVVKARQRLEQGADGAIDQGRRKIEQSLTDAIGKGLDRLGLPDPAPEKAPR